MKQINSIRPYCDNLTKPNNSTTARLIKNKVETIVNPRLSKGSGNLSNSSLISLSSCADRCLICLYSFEATKKLPEIIKIKASVFKIHVQIMSERLF